jgi:hypothetical protein
VNAAEKVMSVDCASSQCAITGCTNGYLDFDKSYANGCECPVSTPTTCASPRSLSLGIAVGSPSVVYTGTLPVAGQDAWFSVTFLDNSNNSFHPKITLNGAAQGEFGFDLYANCTGTLLPSCPDGTCVDLGSWENYNTDTNSPINNPEPLPGTNGTVLIRVYRDNNGAVTCNPYTLTISN